MPTQHESAAVDREAASSAALSERFAAVTALLPLLLSLCIHLSSLLVLVWWMVPGRETSNATEPVRQAAIVIAKANAQQAVDYLEESPVRNENAASSASQPK